MRANTILAAFVLGCLLTACLANQQSTDGDTVDDQGSERTESFRLVAVTPNVTVLVDEKEVFLGQRSADDYPDAIWVPIWKTDPSKVCFVNGDARACADFIPDQTRSLEITIGGKERIVEVTAVLTPPRARFTPEYQAAYRGRTTVEVPEPYELVNIVIAITPTAIADPNLVYQKSDYYNAVRAHFDRFAHHPLVSRIDEALKENIFNYFSLKMNAYTILFSPDGSLVRSPIYNRAGFDNDYNNNIIPYINDLQGFAEQSGFREFYAAHQELYSEQIRFFEVEADVSAMNEWLMREFPSVPPYDGIKIVFSPLVAYNQSLTAFEADGYRELQPHINFPYDPVHGMSISGGAVRRSTILFTEMNHGYINPTARAYQDLIASSLEPREFWADDDLAAQYYVGPQMLFNEYMNWGLVSLYYADRLTDADFSIANDAMVRNLIERRGFRQFAPFDAELLRLYRARKPGEPVEALYPQIIGWFAAHGATNAPSSNEQ